MQQNETISEAPTFSELYREIIRPRDFGIALCCPGRTFEKSWQECCNTPLLELSCPVCDRQKDEHKTDEEGGIRVILGRFFSSVGISLAFAFAVFATMAFSGIGFFMFGRVGGIVGLALGVAAAKINLADLLPQRPVVDSRLEKRADRLEELAMFYQRYPECYNQAAACYLAWLTSWPAPFGYPREFAPFLRSYRDSATAHPKLREALFNAVVAQVCGLCLRWKGWPSALDAAFIGSVEQERFIESFYSAAADLAIGSSTHQADAGSYVAAFGWMKKIVAYVLSPEMRGQVGDDLDGDVIVRRVQA